MQENTLVFETTITKLLESKKYATLRDIMVTMNPADIAAMFEDVDQDKLTLLFRLLPKELAAETFVEMESEDQEMLIRSFSDSELKEVVDELYVDDAADIVEEMPANVVKRILAQSDPEMRNMINEILKYPQDSAGSIMTTEYVSLRPEMTAEEAIKRIRRTGIDKETIYTCYVTTDDRQLIGYVSIRTLLISDDDERVADIMDENVISATTTDDQEDVANLFSKYNFMALPVVDKENRLVGIVTVDDAIDVIKEEATEDIGRMAAISTTGKPYLKQTVFEIWKARIPWLILLMMSATFTSLIITHYESALATYIVLNAFIPMLTGTGGNSGSQSSVSIIRGLSLGEIEFSDFLMVFWKEFRVSLLCGISLAAVSFLKVYYIDGALFANGDITLVIALVISATMMLTVITAKIVGCILPLIAEKIHLDPAVMASPLITTVVDALSLLIYFVVARMILNF